MRNARSRPTVLPLCLILFAGFSGRGGEPEKSWQVLTPRTYHLRTGQTAEWDSFDSHRPDGRDLEIKFKATSHAGPATLFFEQADIKYTWSLRLNGRELKKLYPVDPALIDAIELPGGILKEGDNLLSLTPPREAEDITIGRFRLAFAALTNLLNQTALEVEVLDKFSRQPIPARLTIVDERKLLVPINAHHQPHLAVRPGVVYSANGQALLGLLPGEYTIWATRGPEYSLAKKKVLLRQGRRHRVQLELQREVTSPGWVSCDPHLHTLTFSGHGDSTARERVITLAGENVEVAVATEHNRHTDYSTNAHEMGLNQYFSGVIGNEVTTRAGHFNIFPVVAGSKTPDFNLLDWKALDRSMRETPGVQVVILNHPRDLHSGFIPFASTNFNPVTGANLRGGSFDFDAVEVINSGALRSDLFEVLRDWFALLNSGRSVTAIGASDSHDVSRFIVGQARTYLRVPADDPAKVDVEAMARSLKSGKAVVSMGLLPDLKVNGALPGDLISPKSDSLEITAGVLHPSWIRVDRVELFANGIKIRERKWSPASGPRIVRWKIPKPSHDVHLVMVASGPGVEEPYWAIPRPYQAASPIWRPKVIGITNPIWVDADGDGAFQSAHEYARRAVESAATTPAKLISTLARYDLPVAAHAAALSYERGEDISSSEFLAALKKAPAFVREGFRLYGTTLGAKGSPESH